MASIALASEVAEGFGGQVRFSAFRFFEFVHSCAVLLFCCYTPAHEVLYRQIFLPSVPAGFEVRPHLIEETGQGDFLSPEFLNCIRKKIDLVVKSIEQNSGGLIVWSDVDIRFVSVEEEALQSLFRSSGKDILFQRETLHTSEVNTGFFICECNRAVLDFFLETRRSLEEFPEENEQMVINRLLSNPHGLIKWGHLPSTFYARSQGWPPPIKLAIYHANSTKGEDGLGQKFSQFSELDQILKGGWTAWLGSILRRLTRRASGLAKRST